MTLLKNLVYGLAFIFGEKFGEVLELIKVSSEKSIQIIQGPKNPFQEKENAYLLLITNAAILSSRKFNSHFNYNENLLNLIKKILIYSDTEKRKQKNAVFFEYSKISIKKFFVRSLMMRGMYDTVVEKMNFLLANKNLHSKRASGLYNF